MKTFRGIDGSGDWNFGQGTNTYFTRDAAIRADIRTSLLFFLNDFFAAMSTGIDWWNLLAAKNPVAQANITLQTRQAIITREGVVRINSVEAIMDTTRRTLTLRYNIDTIFTRNVLGFVNLP